MRDIATGYIMTDWNEHHAGQFGRQHVAPAPFVAQFAAVHRCSAGHPYRKGRPGRLPRQHALVRAGREVAPSRRRVRQSVRQGNTGGRAQGRHLDQSARPAQGRQGLRRVVARYLCRVRGARARSSDLQPQGDDPHLLAAGLCALPRRCTGPDAVAVARAKAGLGLSGPRALSAAGCDRKARPGRDARDRHALPAAVRRVGARRSIWSPATCCTGRSTIRTGWRTTTA